MVLVLLVTSLIGLVGFLALAIDLGMLAIAKSQCQNAADVIATAGARTLNGDTTASNFNNYNNVDPIARSTAGVNYVLSRQINTTGTDSLTAKPTVEIKVGQYLYDRSAAVFRVSMPTVAGTRADATQNWSLVQATVRSSGNALFSRIFGKQLLGVTANASAVHRPRDTVIILDFSGSMRYSSILGVQDDGTGGNYSNNPDPIVPKFGSYSDTTNAAMVQTRTFSSGSPSNFTAAVNANSNRTPIVEAFYSDYQPTRTSPTPAKAFTSGGNGDSEGYVSGDKSLKITRNTGSSYAKTLEEIAFSDFTGTGTARRSPAFETSGYGLSALNYGASGFQGWTRGPAYYGKTFFIWPPDPRDATATGAADYGTNGEGSANNAKDWRQRFFLMQATSHVGSTTSASLTGPWIPVDDNARLWNEAGHWRSPRYNYTAATGSSANFTALNGNQREFYRVNYRAILRWLFTEGPDPFPAKLMAGRILYYDAKPNWSDANLNTRWWSWNTSARPSSTVPSGMTRQQYHNEWFWKDYIDFVLGISCSGGGGSTGRCDWTTYNPSGSSYDRPSVTPLTGYGDDFVWGTVRITPKADLTGTTKPYMHSLDNPRRPKNHFWFGPLSMVDYITCDSLSNTTRYLYSPGTSYEAPLYALKIGISAAIKNIRLNHPNDVVSLIFFSDSRFKRARVGLGRDYQRMLDSLWFPQATLNNYNGGTATPVSPFDSDNREGTPRADGGTSYPLSLMWAFNQFSDADSELKTYNSSGQAGETGGYGRRGSRRLIIFETDGLPNTVVSDSGGTAIQPLTKAQNAQGANTSYYKVRYKPSSADSYTTTYLSDNNSTVVNQIRDVCNQICGLESTSGFSTIRKPVYLHALGFGPAIQPGSSARTAALTTLQMMEQIGQTQDANAGTPLPTPGVPFRLPDGSMEPFTDKIPEFKLIYGPDGINPDGSIAPGGVADKLQKAIDMILTQDVKIALIE